MSKSKPDLSIVLPFYNEERSIPTLLNNYKKFKKNYNFELICVNNGSIDGSEKVFKTFTKKPDFQFIKIIAVKKNIGYGHGIMTGVRKSAADIIAWTHADMQTHPSDVFKAYDIFKNENSQKVIVKGNRVDRPIFETTRSIGMGILATLWLRAPLYEVNAQPKLFHKSLVPHLSKAPNDFLLDLFLLYQGIKHNFRIKTFNVHFYKRTHGESKWAYSIRSRFKMITRTAQYIYQLSRTKKDHSTKLIPLFSWLFSPFDKRIGQTSLPNGMRALRDGLFGKGNVTVKGLSTKTIAILKSQPVILVCNHPFDAEVILLLGSLPNRKDVAMIGSDSQVRMGHQFAKYIIKVYTYRQEQEGKNLKLSSRVARYTYRKSSGLSNEQMHLQNRAAITNAASKINHGGLVVMFPQGTSSKIEWRPGIGYLISQLNLSSPTFLSMAYIADSSNADFLRMIPGLNMILPRPSVTFGAPIRLTKHGLPKKPKKIASFLEKKYLNWIKKLEEFNVS